MQLNQIMKTNSLFFLASLVVLAATASAAANQPGSDTLVLPAYIVTAPRCEPLEQQINVRLKEFAQQALTPMVIVPELSLLKAPLARPGKMAGAARAPLAGPVAKL